MTLKQLTDWTPASRRSIESRRQQKVQIPTVFTSAPGVIEAFKGTEYFKRLEQTGIILSYICPLMYMNNPLSKKMPVITSSNKLRTYTSARFYADEEILTMITKGGCNNGKRIQGPRRRSRQRTQALVSHGGFNTLASYQMAMMFGDKQVKCGDQNNGDLYKSL